MESLVNEIERLGFYWEIKLNSFHDKGDRYEVTAAAFYDPTIKYKCCDTNLMRAIKFVIADIKGAV